MSSELVRRQARSAGAKEMAATLPGVGAWGLITGIAMVKSGLTSAQALGMNWPHKLGVFAAVIAGVAGALVSERTKNE